MLGCDSSERALQIYGVNNDNDNDDNDDDIDNGNDNDNDHNDDDNGNDELMNEHFNMQPKEDLVL